MNHRLAEALMLAARVARGEKIPTALDVLLESRKIPDSNAAAAARAFLEGLRRGPR